MKEHEKLAIDGGNPVIVESMPTGVSGPSIIGDEEIDIVTDLLRRQQLFRYSENSETAAFEKEAAELLGVEFAVMVNSGTSALICALIGVGVGPGDEVIIPGYTYISTASAVVAVGAVPVIAEIDDSLGLDPADVIQKITPYTKAVILVHMRGTPARLDALIAVAREHDLKIVEDSCQCVGGSYKGKPIGTLGDVGTWSLNYYKTISSGEGGLVFTNYRDIFERASYASDPGFPMWTKSAGDGWSNPPFSSQTYRPSEITGAIGRAQLHKLSTVIEHQRAVQNAFLGALVEGRGYKLQHMDDPGGDTGVAASIIVHDEELAKGYALALEAEGVPAATIYNEGIPDRHIYSDWDSILNKQSPHPTGYPWKDPAYKGNVEYSKGMCPQTLSLLGRSIRFDFHMNLTVEHARLMGQALNKVDAALG